MIDKKWKVSSSIAEREFLISNQPFFVRVRVRKPFEELQKAVRGNFLMGEKVMWA